MKPFLQNHSNGVLVFLAVIFSALVVGYFIWGISYIVMNIGEANANRTSGAQPAGFDIAAAAALTYRGAPPQLAATSSF